MNDVSTPLERAFADWRSLLGDQYVADVREHRNRTPGTSGMETSAAGILQPANTTDVRDCLEIASRHGVEVHPQSRGKNFGYGGGHPSTDGAVILDLGRMDEILEFDDELGYVTLEPGVTFRQLHEFLRERDSQFQCPINGAPNDASPIGNRLERGQVGVHWQAQGTPPLADLEVVFPDGRRIHTGAASLPGARAASVRSFPPGPDPTELFTQSNLGVVTRATLWLPRANDKPRFVTFDLPDPEAFRRVLPGLRDLLFEGIIEPGFQLHNDYRMFAGRCEWNYPTDELGDTTPVPESMLEDVPSWSATIFLRPEDPLAGWHRARQIRSRLSPHIDGFWHVGPFVQTIADTLETPARMLGLFESGLASIRQFFDLAGGRDVAEATGLPYWRRPTTPDEDESPNFPADGCGLIWFSVVVPMRADDADRVNRRIRQTVLDHGFEPMLFFQVGNKRSLTVVLSLVFDREQPEQCERARACIRALADWSAETGHYPYRLSLPEMDLLSGTTDDFSEFVRDLKQTLDPAGILSPGRYDYRDDWEES